MPSTLGKAFTWFMRNFFAMNKEGQDQIEAMRKTDKIQRYKLPKNIEEKRFTYKGLPIETYKVKGTTPKNVVYYLHGGAYIGKLNGMYRGRAADFIKAGGDALYVLMDYRLAPDHKYPCALEDAMKVWEWLENEGYKAENIITVGDSAGGNLNLAMNLKLRDEGRPMPRAIVCISPWGDMLATGDSYISNFNSDPMFGDKKTKASKEMIPKFLDMDIYTWCKNEDRSSPYISPTFADFTAFPPMFITAGGGEMLLSDSVTIYENCLKNGVDCKIRIDEGMFHIYPLFTPYFKEAKEAFNSILEFVAEQFRK